MPHDEKSLWLSAVREALAELGKVSENAANFCTAEDYLSAAWSVEKAMKQLGEVRREGEGEGAPISAVGELIREARDPREGAPITWAAVAKELGLSSPQRAHAAFGPNKTARLEATRERIQAYREPHPRVLPGLSLAEAANTLSINRHTAKAWSETGKIHTWPLLNSDGTPITTTRAGKTSPVMRAYLTGCTLEEAAAEMAISPSEIRALASSGLIASAPQLDAANNPIVGTNGDPAFWYWPSHRTPSSEAKRRAE